MLNVVFEEDDLRIIDIEYDTQIVHGQFKDEVSICGIDIYVDKLKKEKTKVKSNN